MDTKVNVFDYIDNYAFPKEWEYIVIHHSLTKDSKTVDWTAIKDYHVNVCKWDDIGYHFGVESIGISGGNKYEYMIGRPLNKPGAHTAGYNQNGIGICLVGNYDYLKPAHQQYQMVAKLCRQLMSKYKIPLVNVIPHWYAVDYKACPGKHFNMLVLRDYIKGVA